MKISLLCKSEAAKHKAEPIAVEKPKSAEAADPLGDNTESEELKAQQIEKERELLQAPEPQPKVVQSAQLVDPVT